MVSQSCESSAEGKKWVSQSCEIPRRGKIWITAGESRLSVTRGAGSARAIPRWRGWSKTGGGGVSRVASTPVLTDTPASGGQPQKPKVLFEKAKEVFKKAKVLFEKGKEVFRKSKGAF